LDEKAMRWVGVDVEGVMMIDEKVWRLEGENALLMRNGPYL